MSQVLSLFEILPHICNSVQPNSLRDFLTASLQLSVSLALHNSDVTAFPRLMACVKKVFQTPGVHEANKTLLATQMEAILSSLPSDPQHPVLRHFADCASELPAQFIERMSSPSVWWDVTDTKLRQALAIRSAVALRQDNSMPLVWLNEIVDAAGLLPQEHSTVLRGLLSVMVQCRQSNSNTKWLTELLGRTQAALSADNTPEDSLKVVLYLLDVVMGSVIVLSGFDIYFEGVGNLVSIREARLRWFPAALSDLFRLPQWLPLQPQVAEWIYRLAIGKELPLLYRNVFKASLASLRTYDYCKRPSKWTKFCYFSD